MLISLQEPLTLANNKQSNQQSHKVPLYSHRHSLNQLKLILIILTIRHLFQSYVVKYHHLDRLNQ